MIGKCAERIRERDQFGQGFGLSIVPGTSQLNTLTGAMCTIIFSSILLAFSYQKVQLWLTPTADVTTVRIDDYFDEDDRFEAEAQGLYFAFALTNYDSGTELVEDETYGKLVARYNGWGNS